MPRRVSMPGADELFRSTAAGRAAAHQEATQEKEASAAADRTSASSAPGTASSGARASGRVKHDEKMTVYLTSDELLALEQARLRLRSMVGRNVDRGRLVRAALAIALDDLDAQGDSSAVVRRLEDA
jgi:hypothetical protein